MKNITHVEDIPKEMKDEFFYLTDEHLTELEDVYYFVMDEWLCLKKTLPEKKYDDDYDEYVREYETEIGGIEILVKTEHDVNKNFLDLYIK